MTVGITAPSLDVVAGILRQHTALYRRITPIYQTELLTSLAYLWNPAHREILDIGGGTGLMAEAMRHVFKLARVVSLDVEDRYLPGLGIETVLFDGMTLPAADGSFDAVVLNNVLHHVPRANRAALLRECGRVSRGPIYIKDHLSGSRIDALMLAALDVMGNVPFSGMVTASYLTRRDWADLAEAAGLRMEAETGGAYRSGVFAWLFPNRLEITMRWTRYTA